MARDVTVLSGSDLRDLLTLDVVVPAIEAAYLAAAQQQAVIYPVIRERLEPSGGVFGIKSGYWPQPGSLGLKVAGYWPGNRGSGLDNHQAMVVLVDPATGVPRAIIDGNIITSIRTSAAGAIGLRYLANPDAVTALIVGTGIQAEAQARALHWWRRGIDLTAFEPVDAGQDAAREFCDRLAEQGIACQPAATLETAAGHADVVVTTTPAREPVVRREWLRAGVHVNAMGADTAGKQEHEIATLRDSLVVVDDWDQAARLGECQHAVRAGLFSAGQHPSSIGEVIAGTADGRTSGDQRTLFDATGLALQDLAAAELAASLAAEHGKGRTICLD